MRTISLKTVTCDGKVKISLNLPYKLLEEIAEDLKHEGISRTSWLTLAVIERLKRREKENLTR